MRILLLEDNRDHAQSLVNLLAFAGYELVAAENGREGLKLLQTQHFDGAIVDLFMPGMNGWEFIDQMDAQGPKVPVIVVSGYADVEPPNPHHAVPILAKPYAPGKLLEMIEKWPVSR